MCFWVFCVRVVFSIWHKIYEQKQKIKTEHKENSLSNRLLLLSSEAQRGAQCGQAESSRRDCGYMGITESGCGARGCCWTESNSPGVPWCYDPEQVGEATLVETIQQAPPSKCSMFHEKLSHAGNWGVGTHFSEPRRLVSK